MNRWLYVAIVGISLMAVLTPCFAQVEETTFNLAAEASVLNCFSANDGHPPVARVTVNRGRLNDVLILHAEHLKPNTGFDLFTVQNSNLLADGSVDPNFKGFGLAWYQTDVESDSKGRADVAIKTILLDQIFGFDPAVGLLPTNTFHVGFWFNDPQDAAACGFDPTHPTPFNGEHKAGPAGMLTVPDSESNLGPRCAPTPNRTGKGALAAIPSAFLACCF